MRASFPSSVNERVRVSRRVVIRSKRAANREETLETNENVSAICPSTRRTVRPERRDANRSATRSLPLPSPPPVLVLFSSRFVAPFPLVYSRFEFISTRARSFLSPIKGNVQPDRTRETLSSCEMNVASSGRQLKSSRHPPQTGWLLPVSAISQQKSCHRSRRLYLLADSRSPVLKPGFSST